MDTIFVFGSNREGRHGKGAALEARQKHGARNGKAEGIQGRSYAIITKELRPGYPKVTLDEVREGVVRFLEFARAHAQYTFLLTPIGTGLAGFTNTEIMPLFAGAPPNVKMPAQWAKM